MINLDTDHLSVLQYEGVAADELAERLDSAGDEVATTIVSAEEPRPARLGGA